MLSKGMTGNLLGTIGTSQKCIPLWWALGMLRHRDSVLDSTEPQTQGQLPQTPSVDRRALPWSFKPSRLYCPIQLLRNGHGYDISYPRPH